MHTPGKLVSVLYSPSGGSHPYLLSAEEEEARDYFGVSAHSLSPVIPGERYTLWSTWVTERKNRSVHSW